MSNVTNLREFPINTPATGEQQRLLARAAEVASRQRAPRWDLLAHHPRRDDPTALRVYLANFGWHSPDAHALVVATPETTLADLALVAAAGMGCEPFHLWELFVPHPDARLRNRGSEFLAKRGFSQPPPHNTKGHTCPNCTYFGITAGSFDPDDPNLGPADLETYAATWGTTVAESAADLLGRDDWAWAVGEVDVRWKTEGQPHPVRQDAPVLGFPADLPFAWKYDLGSGAPGLLRAVDLLSQSHLAALYEGQPHSIAPFFFVMDGDMRVNPEED